MSFIVDDMGRFFYEDTGFCSFYLNLDDSVGTLSIFNSCNEYNVVKFKRGIIVKKLRCLIEENTNEEFFSDK